MEWVLVFMVFYQGNTAVPQKVEGFKTYEGCMEASEKLSKTFEGIGFANLATTTYHGSCVPLK